ncbi:MAG TPA: alpha/beta hydrolase [Nitriliruptorales bacterium]
MTTVALDGAPLAYDVRGEGPPVVFVHAGVADRRMWDAQVEALADEFTVVTYDLRGFGSSPNPPGTFSHHEQLLALMDHLDLDVASVVGASLGSYVALSAAVVAPNRVSRLALLAPVIDTVEPDDAIIDFWQREGGLLEDGDLDGAARLNVDVWVVGPAREADDVDQGVRELVFEMQRAAFASEDDGEETELEPGPGSRLDTITQPVLLMLGEHDQAWVRACAYHLAELLVDAQLEVVDDAAHLPSLEHFERVNALLRRFLSV